MKSNEIIRLVQYPCSRYFEAVSQCVAEIERENPPEGLLLRKFAGDVRAKSQEELEEIFTATFDLDPDCALEIGWHLFGEDRKRGVFLAKVRGELQKAGITETGELPDHVIHILELLPKMDKSAATEFVRSCVLPAITRISEALEGKESLYSPVFKTLLAMLAQEYGVTSKGEMP